LGAVLRGLPVIEAQYVQTDVNKIEIHLVKDKDFNMKHEYQITEELKKRVGGEFMISFKYFPKLDRGPGGKFRTVIRCFSEKVPSHLDVE
jgi:hypothetical protein